MKRALFCLSLFAMLVLFGGCNNQASDSDKIKEGINEHLSSLKTLNLSAMDMSIQNVSIQGNQAQAQVEFRPKTGAPQGAGMQVNYSLEKRDEKWVVQNSVPSGGAIQHPAPGQNPHGGEMPSSMPPASTAPASTALPNFRGLVNSGSGSSLPPGHPPINGQNNAQLQ